MESLVKNLILKLAHSTQDAEIARDEEYNTRVSSLRWHIRALALPGLTEEESTLFERCKRSVLGVPLESYPPTVSRHKRRKGW